MGRNKKTDLFMSSFNYNKTKLRDYYIHLLLVIEVQLQNKRSQEA